MANSGSEIFHICSLGERHLTREPDYSGQQVLDNSGNPVISADGRFVVFGTAVPIDGSSNTGLPEVFERDLTIGNITRVSVANEGQPSQGYSIPNAISADGRFIAFESSASNLVANDTNGTFDIFIRDRWFRNDSNAPIMVNQSLSASTVAAKKHAVITMSVTNSGTDLARRLSMVNVLPANVIPISITSSRGQCFLSKIVVCRLGALDGGATATMQLTAKSRIDGVFTSTASALAASLDDDLLNNFNDIELQVTP